MSNYKRFFVEWSSYFDSHSYNIEKIKEVLQIFPGVINIRLAKRWKNQPEVICFSIYYPLDSEINRTILETYINKIRYRLEGAFNCIGFQSIFINEKDF